MAERILQMLSLMFSMYDKEPTKEVMAMYAKILKEYDLEAVKVAINKAVRECEFCPKPANILKHLDVQKDDLMNKARFEWEKVLKSVVRNKMLDTIAEDKITEHLMGGAFSIDRISDRSEKDLQWIQKDFITTYMDYARSDSVVAHIEQKKGVSSTLVLDMAKKLTNRRISE